MSDDLAQKREARAPQPRLEEDLELLRASGASTAERHRRRRRRRRTGLLLLVLVLVSAAAAAGLYASHRLRPAPVDLVALAVREVGVPGIVLSASGYLEARRQITLSSKAQGKIVEMPVEEGQRISTGDLVARIENDEQRAALRLAEAEFADAARELRRMRQLSERGSLSQAEVDRARTAYQVAEARRELARVGVANTFLRAPIDGTVIRKIRDVGEFLTLGVTAEGDPGTAVATLADLSAIDVSLEIGETEIRHVKIGGVALVAPEALPDRRYLADVIEVAAMADRQKGVVPVEVRIRAPDAELLPDLTARVSFLENEPDGPIEVRPALPESAVRLRGGTASVFVLEDERAFARVVESEPADEGWLVVEGLEEGSYVVLDPPEDLESGDRVEVRTP